MHFIPTFLCPCRCLNTSSNFILGTRFTIVAVIEWCSKGIGEHRTSGIGELIDSKLTVTTECEGLTLDRSIAIFTEAGIQW